MLVDTSGYFLTLDTGDPAHPDAQRLYDRARSHLTHNLILAELVPLGDSRGIPRERVLNLLDRAVAHPRTKVIYVDDLLHARAVRFLRARPDKPWSLCDAVSFLLMDDFRVSRALTTDRHFDQAGFIRLLRP